MLTESQVKTFNGSVFQTDGAATRKARQAKLVFANGTERSGTEDERVIRGHSRRHSRLFKYCGDPVLMTL